MKIAKIKRTNKNSRNQKFSSRSIDSEISEISGSDKDLSKNRIIRERREIRQTDSAPCV